MNINFGLFPPIEKTDARGRRLRGRERKQAVAHSSLDDLDAWLGDPS
jgi:methylenetetrahydrofolate--tRNA-(uracil-5-)-methyltransferase